MVFVGERMLHLADGVGTHQLVHLHLVLPRGATTAYPHPHHEQREGYLIAQRKDILWPAKQVVSRRKMQQKVDADEQQYPPQVAENNIDRHQRGEKFPSLAAVGLAH